MPKNKRESLIFTVLMCFVMVLWMSIYNIIVYEKSISLDVLKTAWLGFPIAYIIAMACDWFVVSKLAKRFAFKYLIQPKSSPIKKALSISTCMVILMVLVMSFYGAIEVSMHTGSFSGLLFIWLHNIPINLVMALPFQLLIAGPIVRLVFRKAFPEGTISA